MIRAERQQTRLEPPVVGRESTTATAAKQPLPDYRSSPLEFETWLGTGVTSLSIEASCSIAAPSLRSDDSGEEARAVDIDIQASRAQPSHDAVREDGRPGRADLSL